VLASKIGGYAFAHIPKCGGTAVRSVLPGVELASFLPMGEKCPVVSIWHWLAKKPPGVRGFTIVRHPCEWVRSYWCDQSPQRVEGVRYLRRFWSDDINEFAANLCAGHPGYVSELYRAYTSHAGIRAFRLEDGLGCALKWATGRNINVGMVNESPERGSMTDETRRLIMDSERWAAGRFRYD